MRAVLRIWRGCTVLALVMWFLLAALTGGAWFKGFLSGDVFSDSSMIVYFMEGPSFTYREFYHSILLVFILALQWVVTCAVTLFYQRDALRANSLLPDGKWSQPVITAVLHAAAVAYWLIFM